MIVMPSNNSNAHKLADQYPGCVGMLIGPGGWRTPKRLPFAFDNGRFSSWSKGKDWEERGFWDLLERDVDPSWVVVPDVVGDAVATFEQWQLWKPRLEYWTLALAVQDGMTPDTVRKYTDPGVIFVGGTTAWKRQTIWQWCHEFPRVHVGRINTEKWLWNCAQCGAESCDGTGYFRGDQQQLAGLHRFLRRYSQGLSHPQLRLEFARSFGGSVPRQSFLERT